MISRRIPSGKDKQGQAKRHDFRKLGNYCRDASHAGEKCLMSWYEGCLAPDYDLALEEIIATQAMNSRAKNDKTYHLTVSFRPEDEAKLTPEDYKKIELAMARPWAYRITREFAGFIKIPTTCTCTLLTT